MTEGTGSSSPKVERRKMLVKMKEELKVSIIIPVYNVEQYIGNCLRSVMRQTYQGAMECLLIDDCGTDDSIAVAEGMIREYNDNANLNLNANLNEGGGIRFRIIRHERNRGLSAARNTGTFEAVGENISITLTVMMRSLMTA